MPFAVLFFIALSTNYCKAAFSYYLFFFTLTSYITDYFQYILGVDELRLRGSAHVIPGGIGELSYMGYFGTLSSKELEVVGAVSRETDAHFTCHSVVLAVAFGRNPSSAAGLKSVCLSLFFSPFFLLTLIHQSCLPGNIHPDKDM